MLLLFFHIWDLHFWVYTFPWLLSCWFSLQRSRRYLQLAGIWKRMLFQALPRVTFCWAKLPRPLHLGWAVGPFLGAESWWQRLGMVVWKCGKGEEFLKHKTWRKWLTSAIDRFWLVWVTWRTLWLRRVIYLVLSSHICQDMQIWKRFFIFAILGFALYY